MNKTKVRIYELASELKLDSKKLLVICDQLNITAKSPSSTISEFEAERVRKVAKPPAAKVASNSSRLKKASEDWGYIFVGSTVDNLIRHLEDASTLKAYPEFNERREYAHELLYECVGQRPCLFHIRRKGAGKAAKEEIWELIIATDSPESKLPSRLQKLGKTLAFKAAVQQNSDTGLKLLSVYLLPISRGQADAYAVPFNLRLLPNHEHHIGIPSSVFPRIAEAPVCGDYIPTEEQLKAWKAFLQIEEKIAQARQFCISYTRYHYNFKRRISFEIDITSATLDGSPENPLDEDNFWVRVRKAKNDDLKLFETAPTGRNWQEGRLIGSIAEIDQKRCTISLNLERDLADYLTSGRYQLPTIGFLCFEALGDIKQIQRKKKALDDLNNGRTQNPYLGNFLFDASQARPIQKTVELEPEELLLSTANPGQKAAVETVLSAEDLVLIQGPPGTGKTTVIAEICYQIALRGGRTLIASQANLAVDNALSRLVHNPVIRAIRKGRAEKVGEEGQPFLEDQVIGTWLENTAHDCETNLSKRRENVEFYRQLLASTAKFNAYFQAEAEFQQSQQDVNQRLPKLEGNVTKQEALYQEAVAKKNQIETLVSGLENLLKAPNIVNWEAPEVTNFLPHLKPYTENNHLVKTFLVNVSKAISLTDGLGLLRPQCGAFGLAVWLRETVVSGIPDFRTALIYAQSATVAMLEVAAAVEVFKQHSHNLQQLEKNHQQFFSKQHSLQQTIQTWETRKQEIEAVINAVKEWKSTANHRVAEILANSRQSSQLLTVDLLQLPPELLTLANSQKISLMPANYIVNLPDWELLTKAITYEIEGNFTDRKGRQHSFSYFLQQNFSQIPLLLENSDIIKWQEIHKQFNNYQYLEINQRQTLVETTRIFLQRIQQTYSNVWEPNNSPSTLNKITQELIDIILTNARQCVFQVKTEAEKQLQHLQAQLNELHNNEVAQTQILKTQTQIETARQDANLKLERAINILQELNQQSNVPNQLRTLAEKYLTNQAKIWEHPQEFSQHVHTWINHLSQLENLISSIEPFAVLANIQISLEEQLATVAAEITIFQQQLETLKIKIAELAERNQPQPPDTLLSQRQWWEREWQILPDKFKPKSPPANLYDLEFLRSIKNQFESGEQQLSQDENHLQKYQGFIQDWIAKVRNPSERDRNDLRQIYLDNCNVVGITCVQAAGRDFSEEFQSFDVVIIDEVSKCTPPELLIPALKGKKLVMVGDHRQLPPMMDTNTLEEVVQEIGSSREELQFLEESLFKSQFEEADSSIKQMLTTQYRMHPHIMGAINQFYQGKLECGILQPDIKRAHDLAGELIQPQHHLIWVKMPKETEFQEQCEGTSLYNLQEIDVIERICQQFENTWAAKVACGEPKKEIAVITFYGAQLRKIDERLQSELFPSLQIRTGTVDRFQGMERPIVIVSMVRNNNKGDVGFAKKSERVNVAFSRAQELLVIVGCHDLFTQQSGKVGSMYSEVANIVSHHGGFIDVSRIFS
ncbi:translation initiation factor IF-2 N-terminal domain-containing protein [Calothrix sp. FACHB-1219]|uniref:translation initiation factor IF-2 N-terminal domain-containing protein n=1 Tax=unclassified Calothrix TaxID=2619626 RepID=UPI001683BF9D|nr:MULTISPECIES: translation initiation factor IF-2 N-terminal domain-containing protein [unclassified Calothrix]MBD2207252.1 translation initiation factor IF-2 N-terminal domain-containing protein [Calothrix sp. FACHB-168]MBD2221911.1 translation initiation factor IF-2 N-terminal domain-containing protein [Calothrix sp. FACHB-1219]